MVDYLVERTGFSADQGSIFDDTSLNTSGSFNAQEPATKYMKVAMCVVPQSSADAGFKPLRDTVEMDDSVSNVSVASSSKSHLMLLQSKMVASRAKAKAAALAAEAANDEHILLQAIQEHSNRSNASSRRSGRRPLATAGTDVDQLVDDVFDLSRELSFVVQGGSMNQSPSMHNGETKHEPEERANTDIVSTAASSMPVPIIPAGITTLPLPPLTHFSRMSDSNQPAVEQPGASKPVITIGRAPEISYGPTRGRAKSQTPFSRSQSPKPLPATVLPQTRQVNVEEIRAKAHDEATSEAVIYLQQLQNEIADSHRNELQHFERDAEKKHEAKMNERAAQFEQVAERRHGEIIDAREEQFIKEKQQLVTEKDALINAEKYRLQRLGIDEVERAKQNMERQAAIKIAEFEGIMIAAQQEAERAKHETANARRERDELATRAREVEEKARVLIQQAEQRVEEKARVLIQQVEQRERENAIRAGAHIAELQQKVRSAEEVKNSRQTEFYIGEPRESRETTPVRRKSPDRKSRDNGGGVNFESDKSPLPPRIPARRKPSPDDDEIGRGRRLDPKVLTASRTVTINAKTTVRASHGSGPPDDEDRGGNDDGKDKKDKEKDRKKKDDRRDDKKEPPRKTPRRSRDDDGDDGDSSPESSDDDDESDDDSSNSDHDGTSGEEDRAMKKLGKLLSKRKPGREADKIVLPAVSDAAAFRAWKITTRTNVVAASGMGMRAFKWFSEIEREGMTLKRLYKTGSRFAGLDAKLLSGITDKAHGELGREITQKIEEYAKRGKMFRGRQAVFMVYEYMRVSEQAGALYDISDLMAVKLHNDKLEGFLQSWESILTGMKSAPDPETKEVLFLKQLQHSDQMKAEVAHYERHELGHLDHTYDFLMAAVKRRIQKKRQDKNRKAIEAALGGTKTPAAPAKGKGKGKAKGICYAFRDYGKCDKEDCQYRHESNAAPAKGGGKGKGRSKSPKGKGRGRSNSPKGKGKGKSRDRSPSAGGNKVCWFFLQGSCKFGDKCASKHTKPAAPAPKKKSKKKKANSDSESDSVQPEPKAKARAKAAATPAVRGPGPIGRAVLAASLIATAVSFQFACPASCFDHVLSGLNCPDYACAAPSYHLFNKNESSINNHSKQVKFGEADVVHIAIKGLGQKFYSSARKVDHEHSSYIKRLDTEGERIDAICKAAWWHEQLIEGNRTKSQVYKQTFSELNQTIKASNSTAAAAIIRPRRWLADTGAASDLVSLSEIDKRYILKAEEHEQVTLYTAN